MAFIRKRGNVYYLLHNVRNGERVEQLHLACLGRRPQIDDGVIRGVAAKHPFIRVDWDNLKEKASKELIGPVEGDSQYLRRLIGEVQAFHHNIADVQMPYLQVAQNRELRSQLVSELKLLRGTLDVKLSSSRRGQLMNLRGRLS